MTDKQTITTLYRDLILAEEITIEEFIDGEAQPHYSAVAIERLSVTILGLPSFDATEQCENAFFSWNAEMAPRIIGAIRGEQNVDAVSLMFMARMSQALREQAMTAIEDYLSANDIQELLIHAPRYIAQLDAYEAEQAEADEALADMLGESMPTLRRGDMANARYAGGRR